MTEANPTSCPSCGAAVETAYCGHCGERLLGHHELSFRAQVEQVFHGLFHVDGRFWRSFRYLITRPGFLAAEYCRGARVQYMKPVQILLIANLAYFLLQPYTGYNTFNSTFDLQVERQFYSDSLRPVVNEHLATSGESRVAYAERFDHRASTLARSLLLFRIPVVAALLALLHRRRRRRFAEHLVLATHHLAFQLAFVYLPILWVVGQLAYHGWLPKSELELSVLLLLIDLVWWTFALRRFYEDSAVAALAKAAFLTAAMLPVLAAYRYALFWITFWTT